MAKADGSIIIDTRVDTSGIQKGTKEMQGMFNTLIKGAKGVALAIAAAFSIRAIVNFSKECIALGSDLEEVQNVVDVTFGRMSGQIDEWAKTAAENFGISELAAKQYSSTIGAMFKSMGIQGQELTDMSKKMAELAGDMASFYNLDTDTAFQKIRAGISGETEPLKQLGVNLSEANLEQFRLSQGMTTAYKNMNQQQKALLRYNYLLSVTSDAQGDFARTSNSWANQTRILSLQFQSLKADIGAGLINVLTPVLQVINRIIAGLAKMASAFKAFTNLLTGKKSDTSTSAGTGAQQAAAGLEDATTAANNYADATDKTAKATKKANKENQKYTSGLDKIHQYQSNKSTDTSTPGTGKSKAASPAASSAVDFGQLEQGETALDKVDKKLQDVVDRIKAAAEPLKKAFSGLLGTLKSAFGWILDNILIPLGKWAVNEALPRFFTTLANIITIVDNVLKAAQPGWQWFWDNVLNPIIKFVADKFLQFWDFLNDKLAAFSQWCKDNPKVIENVTTFIVAFFAALTGIKILTGIATMIKSLGSIITVVKTLIAVLGGPWTVAIAAVVALGVVLWKNWDTISAKAKEIWGAISAYLARTWETIKKNISGFMDGARNVWDKGWNAVKTAGTTIWNGIRSTFSSIWNGISSTARTIWNGISTAISGALSNAATVAESVGNKIKTALVNAFNAVKNAIKKPINGIIGFVNGLVSGLVDGINACINALNKLKISIPTWVPVYGGKTMGFNIPNVYKPQIPYLATGAVIPPNSPFTAVLGDQKSGNNIEAPESLIRRIVREETGGSNKKYQFTAVINRRVLFDETIAEARMRQQMTGANPFALA